MNRQGAPSVDRVSMLENGQDPDAHVAGSALRMKHRGYDAPPVRRVYIPKAGHPHKLRPLGISAVEERLLQAAVSRLLGAFYEPVFQDSPFGFRPGRSAHTMPCAECARSSCAGGCSTCKWTFTTSSVCCNTTGSCACWNSRSATRGFCALCASGSRQGSSNENGNVTHPVVGSPQGG